MKTKRIFRKLLTLSVIVVLLLQTAGVSIVAKTPAELRVALISDIHFYPEEMTGGHCEAFIEKEAANGRAIEFTQDLFLATLKDLKARVKKEGIDFLLVAGDMTEWGEYAGHVRVAQLLRQFEKETGVKVAVVPGNHDLSNSDAADFSAGKMEKARYLKHDEFPDVYAKLGYDLPGCERFEGTLSYAADLGKNYRLIALDTNRRRIGSGERISPDELRDWALEQCEKARAAGKTIIGMGHHNLGEQIGGQDSFMSNLGFDNIGETAEAFADAGMHFYFSGHLHFNEIAMRVSDSGEPLYDIITASSAFFPGGYRTAKFSAAGGRIQADVRSHSVPLTKPQPFPDPFYATLYGRNFGSPDGNGLAGWLKYAVKHALEPTLRNVSLEAMLKESGVDLAPLNTLLRYIDKRLFGQPERLIDIINGVVDEVIALPVSELPCTRFFGEYGFGDPDKPGTFEDLGNSALIYLFGKSHDAADDPFMQDALRRIQNGEFVDRLLSAAVPKILAALGGEVLPLLLNNPAAICALENLAGNLDCPLLVMPLLALVVDAAKREAISASLYRFASGVVTSQSPTGGRDGVLVYDGPVDVPTAPGTFRLPQELGVSAGWRSAEITWYTRRSVYTPELKITDKNGNPAPEVKISVESLAEEMMAEQLDIGFTKLLGRKQPVLKHTAKLTGLKPGKTYRFTAGDGAWEWWGEPRQFTAGWQIAV